MQGERQRTGLVSELKGILSRCGIAPSRARGQNFLVDGGLLRWIAGQADLSPGDVVLEVGGGTGFLTRELATRAGGVLVVEIDRGLAGFLEERFAAETRVRVVHADILAGKRALSPEVLAALRDFPPLPGGARKLVANLPYSVAVPTLLALLASSFAFERLLVTVQREVAERLAAAPGTRDYGPATVFTRARAAVRVLRSVPAGAFYPKPKIHSSVVLLMPYPADLYAFRSDEAFDWTVRKVFQHRRKTVAAALRSGETLAALAGPGRAERVLRAAGVDPGLRADQIDLAQFAAVARALSGEFT